MARRRNLILASALSSVVFILGGILVNLNFFDVANDDVLSVIAMSVSCLAPLLGMSAVLMAGKDLERIRKGIVPSSVRTATTWGKMLGLVGSVGNMALLVVFLAQAFSFSGAVSARDSMIQDVNKLSARAYQYRIHPASKRGGEGAYTGYIIPLVLAQNENGLYAATVLHPDTLQFEGSWRDDSTSTVTVRIGPDGRIIEPWIFSGRFNLQSTDQ